MSVYFSGQGTVYGSVRSNLGAPTTYLALGNCPSLILHMAEGIVTNAANGGQALANVVRGTDLPTFSMVLEDVNPNNLALMLYGQNNTVTGGSISGEVISNIAPNTSQPVANINLSSFSLTNGATTYVNGFDYTIDLPTGMITFPSSSTCAASCTANYNYGNHSKVGAATQAPPFMWLRFQGMNTGNTNEPVVVDIYKTKLYPVQDIPLIGDSIVQFPITGRIFQDTSRTYTDAEGQFMRIRKV